jgi:hypothetical protein
LASAHAFWAHEATASSREVVTGEVELMFIQTIPSDAVVATSPTVSELAVVVETRPEDLRRADQLALPTAWLPDAILQAQPFSLPRGATGSAVSSRPPQLVTRAG